jgi:hypothetical protein
MPISCLCRRLMTDGVFQQTSDAYCHNNVSAVPMLMGYLLDRLLRC